MPVAAFRSLGISSLTSFFLLGWSVAATAQTAAAPNAPKVADTTAKAAPAAPVPAAKSASSAKAVPATKTATPAAKPAPGSATAATTPAAATEVAAPVGTPTTETGEPWGKTPAGQPSAVGTSPSVASSPWPDTNAKPADGNAAGPVYYVDQPPNPNGVPGSAGQRNQQPAGPNGDLEPMQLHVEEPPPPPLPRHVAPRTALWLGARVGYFVPFGDLWGRCSTAGYSACDRVDGVKFSDVAASGPMFELDIGARVGRNYVIYLAWERAQLGSADGPSPDSNVAGAQARAESDYVAVGVRLSANPDDIGLLLDLSIGARRFQGVYDGGTKLQLTDAPMESRLGIGVDIRTNRMFSLSPMLTLGLGSFGKADWVQANTIRSAIPSDADRLTHGWVTLQLGGHFDLIGGG